MRLLIPPNESVKLTSKQLKCCFVVQYKLGESVAFSANCITGPLNIKVQYSPLEWFHDLNTVQYSVEHLAKNLTLVINSYSHYYIYNWFWSTCGPKLITNSSSTISPYLGLFLSIAIPPLSLFWWSYQYDPAGCVLNIISFQPLRLFTHFYPWRNKGLDSYTPSTVDCTIPSEPIRMHYNLLNTTKPTLSQKELSTSSWNPCKGILFSGR